MKNSDSNFIDFGHVLGRSEMKKLMAGSGGDCCRIYRSGTTGWSDCEFSAYEANLLYEDFEYVTGYCCASCGEEPWENAQPCSC